MRPRRDPRPAAARVAGDEADGPPTSVEQQQGSEGRDWWSGLDLRTATRWFGLLLGQTTLLGTLLFYFGWVRTQSLLLHFGLDNNLVRQSWSDYILRAPNLVVRGLTFLALAATVLLLASRPAWRWVRSRDRSLTWLVRVSAVLGVLTLVLGVLGFFNVVVYSSTVPFVPIMIGVAAVLLTLSAAAAVPASGAEREGPPRVFWRTLGALLLLTVVLCAFWAVSVYATRVGQDFGRSVEAFPGQRPRVTLYSERDLALAPPARATRLRGERYTVRYTDLRLLIYASDRYVLLPDGWRRGRDPVYLITDSADLRVEIVR